MTVLTFAAIYPQNTKGNRIVIDKAQFTDPNRANDLVFYAIQKAKKLKRSYFIGIEDGDEINLKMNVLKDEHDIILSEGRETLLKFLKY